MVRDFLSLPVWMSVASTGREVCCRNLATRASLLDHAMAGAQNLRLEFALPAETYYYDVVGGVEGQGAKGWVRCERCHASDAETARMFRRTVSTFTSDRSPLVTLLGHEAEPITFPALQGSAIASPSSDAQCECMQNVTSLNWP